MRCGFVVERVETTTPGVMRNRREHGRRRSVGGFDNQGPGERPRRLVSNVPVPGRPPVGDSSSGSYRPLDLPPSSPFRRTSLTGNPSVRTRTTDLRV